MAPKRAPGVVVAKPVIKKILKEKVFESSESKEAEKEKTIKERLILTGVVSEQEAEHLLKITEDPFYLYEILGMVKAYGFQKTVEFITGKNKIEAVFTQEALKKNLQENIYRLKANKEKMEVKSGIYVCGKCKSKRTVSMELQLRRADEPMTTIVTCIDCNFRWTIS